MSGRSNKSNTLLDQPLNLQYLPSFSHLSQCLHKDAPIPKSYQFILILNPMMPSEKDLLSHYRKLMRNQQLPCYHQFFYYDEMDSLLEYVENSPEHQKEEPLLKELLDTTAGSAHGLIVRAPEGERDRVFEMQSKEGLERVMNRLKYVRFADSENEDA